MDLFLTSSGFFNSSWRTLDTHVQVSEDTATAQQLSAGDTLWILTAHANWSRVVADSVQKGVAVVVLAALPDAAEMNQALNSGALCYCPAVADERTIQAVKVAASQDSIWVPAVYLRQMTGAVARLFGGNPKKSRYEQLGLTAREAGVVTLLIDGLSNQDIAARLFITERTVKEHLTNIFKKLDVKDRLQLALLVLKS
ncbi:LuxR family transcriptional regulator [Aliidiomarina maris]|uniref:DNA-binding response regulator n=1 Tax=Aliidiomarina maris TaxID=531312 RepID=A0A327WQ42_9GAMM|nr:response regulator transcription factor [Aliidiomarina maris]RAJ92952.1 regulatory LuxR family protein [Aliidiomarina maris]RUO20103.1 DNA-binding response regulator [Aliidiomarina maris]